MIPNNDPLYKTKNSTIQRFTPFIANVKKETDDLKKAFGQNRDKSKDKQSTPHSGQDELFWNTITNKMDKNLSAAQIEDRIKSLETDGDKKEKNHKYKIVDPKKVKLLFLIHSKAAALFFGVNFLLSLIISHSLLLSQITAPAYTLPMRGPRPASSNPISLILFLYFCIL